MSLSDKGRRDNPLGMDMNKREALKESLSDKRKELYAMLEELDIKQGIIDDIQNLIYSQDKQFIKELRHELLWNTEEDINTIIDKLAGEELVEEKQK